MKIKVLTISHARRYQVLKSAIMEIINDAKDNIAANIPIIINVVLVILE